jgi:CheY-like chemotaxis protein
MTAATRGPVLVVDDDDDIREIVALALGAHGYRVATAGSGTECLRQLADPATERPSIILLDVMMPGMNGLDVCERLAADPALATIPVVLLTGNVQLRSESAPAVPILRKPVELAILVEWIERYATTS